MSKEINEIKIDEIRQLNEKGFVRSSTNVLNYVRSNYLDNFKFFKIGVSAKAGGRGSIKYSMLDLFGERAVYCYDVRKEKEFVNFLVNKFFEINVNPDITMKKVFTRLLHTNGLHWDGFNKKKIGKGKRKLKNK